MAISLGLDPASDAECGYVVLPEIEEKTQRCAWTEFALFGKVVLVLLFSVGAHASRNAVAAAQPALERLGVDPILYSVIAATPMLGAIVFPTAWGAAYADYEKRVLVAVPVGQLVGQLLIAVGLWLFETSASELWAGTFLICGLCIFSAFHGGAHVVQCTVLSRVLPFGETAGFLATIGFTKFIIIVVNFFVPQIMQIHGILGVQLALVLPSIISVLAGCWLACLADTFVVPHRRTVKIYEDAIVEDEVLCNPRISARNMFRGAEGIWLISLWKALVMGTLHSFRTVQNGLVTEYYDSPVQAGDIVGWTQTIALCTSPVLVLVAGCAGRRALIVRTSWLAAIGGVIFTLAPDVPKPIFFGALLSVASASIVVPVLALSLVRISSSRALGWSFGVLESIISFAQVAITLIAGVLREVGGYSYAMEFNCACLCLGAVTSIVLVRWVKDVEDSKM